MGYNKFYAENTKIILHTDYQKFKSGKQKTFSKDKRSLLNPNFQYSYKHQSLF